MAFRTKFNSPPSSLREAGDKKLSSEEVTEVQNYLKSVTLECNWYFTYMHQ